jgi:hypothetical protein
MSQEIIQNEKDRIDKNNLNSYNEYKEFKGKNILA